MSKEIKAQETEKAKSSKKYVVLALVVILAAIGIMVNNDEEEAATATTTVATADKALIAEKTSTSDEPTTARIDITTPLVDAEKPQSEVYVEGSETAENEADWMPKHNVRGYTLQKEGNEITFAIKVLNDVDITMSLRGKWELKNPKNKEEGLKENWVDFTSVTVNGKEILSKAIAVWHNKPFRYTINAKAGKEYNIHAEWQKPDTIPEE